MSSGDSEKFFKTEWGAVLETDGMSDICSRVKGLT